MNNKGKCFAAIAAALAFLAPSMSCADAHDSLSVTGGIDYASGDFGDADSTSILTAPISFRYTSGELSFITTVPWLHIDGSMDVVGGPGDRVILGQGGPRRIRSGLGDVSIGASYTLPEEELGVGMELAFRVKLPTASREEHLGTGKTDAAVRVEISRSIGPVTPFASLGYRMPGKPDGIPLHNALTGAAGFNLALGRATATLLYDYRASVCDCAADAHEIHGRIGVPLGDRMFLSLYGSGGLSKNAPAFGIGSMITYKLF